VSFAVFVVKYCITCRDVTIEIKNTYFLPRPYFFAGYNRKQIGPNFSQRHQTRTTLLVHWDKYSS